MEANALTVKSVATFNDRYRSGHFLYALNGSAYKKVVVSAMHRAHLRSGRGLGNVSLEGMCGLIIVFNALDNLSGW